LGQIQSYDLTNVLIAVVRYYGGTNLGVGGLINAYRTAAKDALAHAIIIEDEDQKELLVTFSYEQMPQVMKLVKSHKCVIVNQSFDKDCEIKLRFPVSESVITLQLKAIQGVILEEVL
jgi:putative IMPACT (imprinted ancient) family translation regulator